MNLWIFLCDIEILWLNANMYIYKYKYRSYTCLFHVSMVLYGVMRRDYASTSNDAQVAGIGSPVAAAEVGSQKKSAVGSCSCWDVT